MFVCVCLELVDLCDEAGALYFIYRHLQDHASQILTPQKTYIVCTINRKSLFLREKSHYKRRYIVLNVQLNVKISFTSESSAGAFISITPHVANPDEALQGNK